MSNAVTPVSKRELIAYQANVKGAIFRQIRETFSRLKQNGFTQKDLAIKIGMNEGQLSRRLRGDYDLRLETLSDLARGLDCRIDIKLTPIFNTSVSASDEPVRGSANKSMESHLTSAWERHYEITCDKMLKAGSLQEPRNSTFIHPQYRPSAQNAEGLAETARGLVGKLGIASETPRGACFVNLSNHPTEKWDDAQRRAALNFAEFIVDVEFPAVPPDADEKAIGVLADNCLARIPRKATHALVQGEFTLTVELVRRLQARGVTCLAATSTRDVQKEAGGRKVSSFTFGRFRAYPEIGSHDAI